MIENILNAIFPTYTIPAIIILGIVLAIFTKKKGKI